MLDTMAHVRTSLERSPSKLTPEERDDRQRALHEELLETHKAVVVRLDQEPGCWADRMLFARGRIVVIRLEKLAFIPRFISMFLETLAKEGWKRKMEGDER